MNTQFNNEMSIENFLSINGFVKVDTGLFKSVLRFNEIKINILIYKPVNVDQYNVKFIAVYNGEEIALPIKEFPFSRHTTIETVEDIIKLITCRNFYDFMLTVLARIFMEKALVEVNKDISNNIYSVYIK